MPTVPFLGSYGDISGRSLMFRNVLINGGFDIWQRATSQTSSGYGSDDRWGNINVGSTKTASRQTFTLGQTDVPGNPTYFSRTVVSSVAGASNFTAKYQAIESVTTLAGQTATVSFWAKADASKNIAMEMFQYFGTGGSPSAAVTGIGLTTCALTTSWKYFTIQVNIPSVSGKVLGTNNDHSLNVQFWFDAGSSFNARTNSLGQQSGTFDIANVQLEAGPQATPFEYRPIGTELALCQRYFERINSLNGNGPSFPAYMQTTTVVDAIVSFRQVKRAVTTVTGSTGASDFSVTIGATDFNTNGFLSSFQPSHISARCRFQFSSGTSTVGLAGFVMLNATGAFIDASAEL